MEARPRPAHAVHHRRLRGGPGRWPARRAHALLAALLCGAVVSGPLFAAPAWAAPPPIQAPPAAPPQAGQVAVTTATSPFPFHVTEIVPGIGVYQGRILDERGERQVLDSLPDGASPVNREFLDRVSAVIGLLDETPEGHRLLSDLGHALPLPRPGTGSWGAGYRNTDGTPSRIRVVIGAAPGLGQYGTIGLDAVAGSNGLGTDSVVAVDPTFPLNLEWRDTSLFASSPVTNLGHELIHAWRFLIGPHDPTQVLEVHRRFPENTAVLGVISVAREELRTVGNAAAEIYDQPRDAVLPLGPDAQLINSRHVVDALVAEYRSAGDQTSVERLDATRHVRTPPSGNAPTERNIAVARGEVLRTHYVGSPHTERPFVLRGNDTLVWQSNLALVTPEVQLRPGDFPDLLERGAPAAAPPSCAASPRMNAVCTGTAYQVQPTIVLQVQAGSDTCLRASSQIAPELYPCNGSQSTQRWTYHPDTKLLSIGGDRMTEVGAAPPAPALCLASRDIGGSRLPVQPCSLSDARQRWEYTTTGLWRAVGDDGNPDGCLNAQGNRTSDGTAVITWYCDHADNGTWNLYRGHLDLGAFQIAATTGAPMESAGDGVTTTWEEKVNRNTVWTQTLKTSTSTLTGYYALRNLGSGLCLVASGGPKLRDCGESEWRNESRWSLYQHGSGMFTLQTDVPPGYLPLCATVDGYGHLNLRGCMYQSPWFNNKYWNHQWRISPTWAVLDRV